MPRRIFTQSSRYRCSGQAEGSVRLTPCGPKLCFGTQLRLIHGHCSKSSNWHDPAWVWDVMWCGRDGSSNRTLGPGGLVRAYHPTKHLNTIRWISVNTRCGISKYPCWKPHSNVMQLNLNWHLNLNLNLNIKPQLASVQYAAGTL